MEISTSRLCKYVFTEKSTELENKLDNLCKKSQLEAEKAELANQELRDQAHVNNSEDAVIIS